MSQLSNILPAQGEVYLFGEKKMKKRLIIFLLLLCIFAVSMPDQGIVKADGGITERKFVTMLMTGMEICESDSSVEQAIEKACDENVVKNAEKSGLSNKLTKERAAVYLNRVDVLVNGSAYDEEMYQNVLNLKRISDLKTMKKASRASVIRVYCKGIMVGYSNGYYIQSRKFKGSSAVTLSEAKTYISRLKNPGKRKKISPDGQLIRTTNLPSNASSYRYVLASFPNSFYEKKFEYQKTTYSSTPKPLVDFASPVQVSKMEFYNGTKMGTVMDKYLTSWCKKVETNIKLRFNVNYKTINNSWISKLRNTYYIFEDDAQSNKLRTDDIKAYVTGMKKNKVVVKTSRVTVEPSTFYNSGKDYVRVYVRFKVVSGDVKSKNLVYSDELDVKNLKKGVWMERCFDIGIGSYNGYSTGKDYAVVDNKLLQA